MKEKSNRFKLLHGELKFDALFKLMWSFRKLYLINLGIAFVIAVIYAFSLPRYYETKVLLAPEYSSGSSNLGGLGGLASLAGINIGSMGGEDAIVPMLYPDLIASTDFLISLFDVQIITKDSAYQGSLKKYMQTEQKVPWWTQGMASVKRLFKSSEGAEREVLHPDPFFLSKADMILAKNIGGKFECVVDKKTNVITLQATDQDPLVSALLVDTVRVRLQDFIIEYRTQKARNDLKHIQVLRDEAEKNYKKNLRQYTAYADANRGLVLQTDLSRLDELKNATQTSYNIYNQLVQQVELAKSKVLERTPAFTVIQNATVPVLPAGPKRSLIVIAFCMLCFLGTTVYIVIKN